MTKLAYKTSTYPLSDKLRFAALIALTLAGLSIAATPASAKPSSVCLAGTDNELRCDYMSLAECRAAASGGLGYCVPAFASSPVRGL
jgi:hypothetical protein